MAKKVESKHVPFDVLYKKDIFSHLKKSYSNVMEVPKLVKITLNMGVGQDAVRDRKTVEAAKKELRALSGQEPIVTNTRISEAGFKIRKGWPIGVKVTLRGQNMYRFLEKLVCVVLPSVRDFRGVSKRAFDGRGNFNMGLKEQIVFPELDYENIDQLRGMNITITTTAKTDEEGFELLKGFSFPFREIHEGQ